VQNPARQIAWGRPCFQRCELRLHDIYLLVKFGLAGLQTLIGGGAQLGLAGLQTLIERDAQLGLAG